MEKRERASRALCVDEHEVHTTKPRVRGRRVLGAAKQMTVEETKIREHETQGAYFRTSNKSRASNREQKRANGRLTCKETLFDRHTGRNTECVLSTTACKPGKKKSHGGNMGQQSCCCTA